MGVSSIDLAGVAASDAARTADDCMALIAWLEQRVADMEVLLAMQPESRPELPSEREQRLIREYYAKLAPTTIAHLGPGGEPT